MLPPGTFVGGKFLVDVVSSTSESFPKPVFRAGPKDSPLLLAFLAGPVAIGFFTIEGLKLVGLSSDSNVLVVDINLLSIVLPAIDLFLPLEVVNALTLSTGASHHANDFVDTPV